MAVSGNLQRALNAKSADATDYCQTRVEAEKLRDTIKENGHTARLYRYNNGSRAKPRWEWMVKTWFRRDRRVGN